MNEIIKEFREKFVVSFNDDPTRDAVDLWGRKEVKELEQFILTKLKEEYQRGSDDCWRRHVAPDRSY